MSKNRKPRPNHQSGPRGKRGVPIQRTPDASLPPAVPSLLEVLREALEREATAIQVTWAAPPRGTCASGACAYRGHSAADRLEDFLTVLQRASDPEVLPDHELDAAWWLNASSHLGDETVGRCWTDLLERTQVFAELASDDSLAVLKVAGLGIESPLSAPSGLCCYRNDCGEQLALEALMRAHLRAGPYRLYDEWMKELGMPAPEAHVVIAWAAYRAVVNAHFALIRDASQQCPDTPAGELGRRLRSLVTACLPSV